MYKYQHLTSEQRYTISTLLRQKYSVPKIAEYIGVSPSTVYREIARNKNSHGHYSPKDARMFASDRRRDCRRRMVATADVWAELSAIILDLHCSPECARAVMLKRGRPCVGVARIYQLVHEDRQRGGHLWHYLPHKLKHRRRVAEQYRYKGCIKNRVSIDERPEVVNLCKRFGDWELDLIVGPGNKGVIVVLVERLTKKLLMAQSPSKSAEDVAQVVVRLLGPYSRVVLTVTTDNGLEFSMHEEMSRRLTAMRPRSMPPVQFYFAHPYSSWEKGLVENTNKLIRQFIPKETDIRQVSPDYILEVQTLLNRRPRKKLGFKTPKSEFLLYLSMQNCT